MLEEKINYNLDLGVKTLQQGVFELADYDGLKKSATEIRDRCKSWVIMPSDIKDAEERRAILNNVSKTFNDKRIAYEKEYMKPFMVGKMQIKELCDLLDEASKCINVQIRAYEEKEKNEKEAVVLSLIKTRLDDAKITRIDASKLLDKKWLNKGYNDTKIIKELDVLINNINAAYQMLVFVHDEKYVDEIVYDFHNQFDKDNIVPLMTRIMNENAVKHSTINKEKKESLEEGKVFKVRYIISGTKNQLQHLSNTLKELGVEYQVEKGEE